MFPETNFRRATTGDVLSTSIHTLKQGVSQLRLHRVLVHILVFTYLVNGADEAFGRLYVKHLANIGFPVEAVPIIWLALLAIASLATSIAALTWVNRLLAGKDRYARVYSFASGIGAFGLVLLATSFTFEVAAASVLIVGGVAMSVTRTISVVWANENAAKDVRATIQSFLSLAENVGEVTLGFCLAVVANYAGIPAALVGSCAVLLCVVLLVESHYGNR